MARGRPRKAPSSQPAARSETQRQTRSNATGRRECEVQVALPGGALQTIFHVNPAVGVSQTPRALTQNHRSAPVNVAAPVNIDPRPNQAAPVPTPRVPIPRPQASAIRGPSTPRTGPSNPLIHVHFPDQLNYQPVLPSGTPVQAFILQTPHRISIAAATMPVHGHSFASVDTPIRQRCATVTVDPDPSSDEQDDDDDLSQTQPRPRKADDVWTFFSYDDAIKKQICIFCKALATDSETYTPKIYADSTGTSVLRTHLQKFHLNEWVKACDTKKITIGGEETRAFVADYRERNGLQTQNDPLSRVSFTKEKFIEAVVRFVVSDDQALNILDNHSFRALLLLMRGDIEDSDIPHRTFLRSRVMFNWQRHLVDLKAEMKNSVGKISLTMDLWTDENLAPFMAVTAHYIEVKNAIESRAAIQLRSQLIGFHFLPGRHTGEHLAQGLICVLDRLGISQKIGWITLDNASNNDTCVRTLATELNSQGITRFDSVENRIRCFPHIVNLACQAVITKITDIDWATAHSKDYDLPVSGNSDSDLDPEPGSDSEPEGEVVTKQRDIIAMLRTIIRVIRSSSLRRDGFSTTCQRLKLQDYQLLRDVDTRWSSTYLMISRALTLQVAIDRYLEISDGMSRYSLQAGDWLVLQNYARILAIPHAFQQVLSAEKTPTLCRAMPAFVAMIARWRELQQELPHYYEVIEAGIEKLEQYHARLTSVPAYVLSILINPTMKLDWFREFMPGQVESIRELLISHLSRYRTTTNTATVGTSSRTPAIPSVNNNFNFGIDPNLILGLRNLSIGSDRTHNLRAEVEAYFLDTYQSADSLGFWQENRSRYPTLFLLALDILPIQGSAVPCERVFSSAKETMTLRRNRIGPDLMEALQMLKYSFNHGRELDFTAGLSFDEEYSRLMQLTDEQASIPEDVDGFINLLNPTVAST